MYEEQLEYIPTNSKLHYFSRPNNPVKIFHLGQDVQAIQLIISLEKESYDFATTVIELTEKKRKKKGYVKHFFKQSPMNWEHK